MARNGYKKITSDADTEKASFVSLLFFQWMNNVFKTGNERALQENDFLPLLEDNTSSFVITRLQAKWEKEQTKCKENGKKPKLWKSVLKMPSPKDVLLIVSTGAMFTLSRILQPLLLGYLMVSLMSATPQRNYLLYGCAVAMGFNELIGVISMHHLGYRCEVMGFRIGSALKGLVYHKVSTKVLIVTCLKTCLSRSNRNITNKYEIVHVSLNSRTVDSSQVLILISNYLYRLTLDGKQY